MKSVLCFNVLLFQIERWMIEKAKVADQVNLDNELVARYILFRIQMA